MSVIYHPGREPATEQARRTAEAHRGEVAGLGAWPRRKPHADPKSLVDVWRGSPPSYGFADPDPDPDLLAAWLPAARANPSPARLDAKWHVYLHGRPTGSKRRMGVGPPQPTRRAPQMADRPMHHPRGQQGRLA
jgi:hypothetical protein